MSGFTKPAIFAAAFFLLIPVALTAAPQDEVREIVFDFGDSTQSVAVLQDRLLVAGDVYENYLIVDFEPQAVVAREIQSFDMVAWVKTGAADEKLLRDAKHLFVVKQMKAIYEAQTRHFTDLGVYAQDLETLIQRGFLEDGFEQGKKLNYTYEIVDAGERRALAYQEKEPFFLARAYPDDSAELYFSVEHLGQVRYGVTNGESEWGPIWDYADPGHLQSRNLGINPEYGGS